MAMTYRHKLLATVVASYAIACLAVAGCLEVVTARYQAAVEAAENVQLDGILNRQVDDLLWTRHAELVRDLARDIAQEPELRRLVEAGDTAALQLALPGTWRRAVVTSGSVAVLGVAALRPDGTTLKNVGALSPTSEELDIEAVVSRREGIDRFKILTLVWVSQGNPVLTVIHPVGGLRRIGYVAVHTNPIVALSKLDQQLGIGLSFRSADSSKLLAALDNWSAPSDAQLRDATISIRRGDGAPFMTAVVQRDVARRASTMHGLRTWSFILLIGIISAVAAVSTALVLALTRQIATETANERCKIAIDNMSQGLAMFDAEGRLTVCNKLYAELYGLTPEQTKPGTTIRQLLEYRHANGVFGDVDFVTFSRKWLAEFNKASQRIQKLADGRVLSIARRPMPDGGLVSTTDDITERRRLDDQLQVQNEQLRHHEAELRTQNLRFKAALDNMGEGLCMFDADKHLVVCNNRYAHIYQLPAELLNVGTPHEAIIKHRILQGVLKGDHSDIAVDQKLSALAQLPADATSCRVDELADGRMIRVTRQPMAGGGWVATHHDITEQRRSEEKIAHMALHDTLTGLPNRALLNERLGQALARAKRGEVIAIHILDLDHFKHVNDTLGHPAGDKLLQVVSDRLRALVRETDTIARMGGDEFAIVQVALSQLTDATSLAQRVIAALCEPYEIDGQHVVIGTSVGITVAPSDGLIADQLIRNGDLALYCAKGDGRGTFRFFEPQMDLEAQARRALEHDLRKALAAGEFELHYQPLINLDSNEISGLEALIRWNHPEKGMVSPAAFISLAEETGLIVPIGEWTIRHACATAAQWPSELKIAVNLSPAQLRSPDLLQMIMSALAASGLAPSRLELEITETVLLQDGEATLAVLYKLREIGVRIAMDDFGTGYSSLSHLQRFPFDKIKIDRSFIKGMAENGSSLNIVRAVAALARGLGVAATAEGVETHEQLDTIRSEGCTEVQGFLLSKPIPADEVVELLLSKRMAQGDPWTFAAA